MANAVRKYPIDRVIMALDPMADVPPRGHGYDKMFCPFHDNTRTPAGSIDWDRESYKCWGCEIAGDGIDLVMAVKEVEFAAAIEFLEEEVGGDSEDVPRTAKRKRRPSLF